MAGSVYCCHLIDGETLTNQSRKLELKMRLGLILGVLALTAYTFFLATSLPQATDDTAFSQALAGEVETLTQTVSALEAENAGQKAQIQTMVAAQGEPDHELSQTIEQLNAALVERDTLMAANADLNAEIAALTAQKARAEEQFLAAETHNGELTNTLEIERAKLTALEVELASSVDEQSSALSSQLVEVQTSLEEARAALSASEQRILELASDAEQYADTVAELTADAANAEGEITSLQAEIAELSSTIAAPAESTASEVARVIPTAASCTEQTQAIMADTKLNFDRGTATISGDSIPAVAGIVDVARACADVNLIIEIGGHTDSRGGELSNQTLSESRAQAVLDFLYSRGVPSVAMRAVGYGESQPIADNDTSEGRAENRRITFVWQER
jgi:outer membrane protein OmpA-like peptidoglycan-associated protein